MKEIGSAQWDSDFRHHNGFKSGENGQMKNAGLVMLSTAEESSPCSVIRFVVNGIFAKTAKAAVM